MVKPDDILGNDVNFIKTEDGTLARKGSVAALIANTRGIQEAIAKNDLQSVIQFSQDIRELIPPLKAIGFFDFFPPIEWLQSNSYTEGKCWVAVLYLNLYPQEKSATIDQRLHKMLPTLSPALQHEIALIG